MDLQLTKIVSLAVIVFLASILNRKVTFRAFRVLDFEIEKCPLCYTDSFCEALPELNIEISLPEFIVGYINRKYVFLGNYKNQSIVIKRLASQQEVSDLDSITQNMLPNENDFHQRSLAILNQSFTNSENKLRLCPTLEKAHILFERMNSSDRLTFIHVWTSLKLNPESLILRVFRSDDGWPVPKLIGACGRISIVENCGKPIRNYRNHDWLFRAHIVEQLLSMALNFTFTDPDFGVYLKDVSEDNIVVDGNMTVRLVDLEHLIIVDKNTPDWDQPPQWHKAHQSEHHECDDCLTYSPLNICSHRSSDHNIYAICKEFLNGRDFGVLHSAPKLSCDKLKFYIEECIQPSDMKTRFEIAEELGAFLQHLKLAGNFSLEEYKKFV